MGSQPNGDEDDADVPDEDTVKHVDALAAIVVVFAVPLFCKLNVQSINCIR